MQLSTSLSDAVLSASAFYAAYALHVDVASFPLSQAPSAADRFIPSIITSVLPPSVQLTSLTSLVEWGYFALGLASAAGVFRFAGALPSLSLPLHRFLTHCATLLAIPCFALAVFSVPAQGASKGVSVTGQTTSTSLPIAALFTSVLSALLFFPLLFRQLPQPISLTSSSQAVSALATVTLLLTSLVRCASAPTMSAAAPFLLLLAGSAPLLVTSAAVAQRPSGTMWGSGMLAVDAFHYGMALTCWVWLMAFRQLLSEASAGAAAGVAGDSSNRFVEVFYVDVGSGRAAKTQQTKGFTAFVDTPAIRGGKEGGEEGELRKHDRPKFC